MPFIQPELGQIGGKVFLANSKEVYSETLKQTGDLIKLKVFAILFKKTLSKLCCLIYKPFQGDQNIFSQLWNNLYFTFFVGN